MGRVVCILVAADHGAAALGGERELAAPSAQVLPDELLAASVVVGGVDEIDPRVQDGIQDRVGLLLGHGPPAPDTRTPNFHRAIAQLRYAQAGSAQRALCQCHYLISL